MDFLCGSSALPPDLNGNPSMANENQNPKPNEGKDKKEVKDGKESNCKEGIEIGTSKKWEPKKGDSKKTAKELRSPELKKTQDSTPKVRDL